MRAQCSICAELFDQESQISATQCGHVFHNHCVTRWLNQSTTCPQCRKHVTPRKVIARLYFDEGDEEASEIDPNTVKNELDNCRLLLKQKDKEKADYLAHIDHLREKIEKLGDAKQSVEILYKNECSTNQSLRRQLLFCEKQQKEADQAKEEAKRVRKKLQDLKAVEHIVQGCEAEVQSMVNQYKGDAKQLAIWCTVIQKEHATKKQECRTLREQLDRMRKESSMRQKLLTERTDELSSVKDTLKHSEEDLKSAEREIHSLQKRIKALQKAIGSPSDTAAAFAHRLINESPAPMKQPRLSTPGKNSGEIDLDVPMTPELFTSPALQTSKASATPQMKEDCKEYGVKYIKMNTESYEGETKKRKRDIQDISNIPGISTYNLFKKKGPGSLAQPSLLRKGYNGLGGHDKFIQPLPRAPVFQKTTRAGKTGSLTGIKPPLPTLDRFIDLTE